VVSPCFIGVDIGTSGCRTVAITENGRIVASARTNLPPPLREVNRGVAQDPWVWWNVTTRVLRDLSAKLPPYRPTALCLDGTSSTLLLCTPDGDPLGPALMYNDTRSSAESARIAQAAPADSPARGASSSLAKALHLARHLQPPLGSRALHQADWLIGRLTGRFGVTDWNNALKLGYDPLQECWPDWLEQLDLGPIALPLVLPPGTTIGKLDEEAALATGLPLGVPVAAGTTDSTAAVIATGAQDEGDAVTCLGSTLVLKVVSRTSVSAPEYGVYSHRLGNLWLVGGASNSGGAVLRRFFTDAEMARMTCRLRPDEPTEFDYYPLLSPGERFPTADPHLPPRLSPRPSDDARFFQGLLEGIAAIEARGYRLLQSLGAPPPTHVFSIGGGANNLAWERIRRRMLGIPVTAAAVQEAAYGAALLALRSMHQH